MQDELVFSLLVVGLEKYTHASIQYPFPAELQHAMNGLALMMGKNYPKTRHDFMALMTEPLTEWWIPYGGPDVEGFDSRFALMYGGEMSDPAEDYLIEGNLRGVNISDLLTLKDNMIMRRFFLKKREAFQHALNEDEAAQIENDYETVRTFVTRNAYTYPETIRRNLPYHLHSTISEMYIPAAQQSARLLFDDKYWHCHMCGMVGIDHEKRRQGLKPDVCDVRCPGRSEWEEVSADQNILVLRTGIQRRTLIPGQIEMTLYASLVNEIQPRNPQLVEVRLYPGVDQYDLRLLFSDNEAWAVDIKDYRLATELGAHVAHNPSPYNNDPHLYWNRAFYVVSDDRERGGYCETAWAEAGLARFPNIKLQSIRTFMGEIKRKIWELEE